MRLTTLNTLIAIFTTAALAATLAGCDATDATDVDVTVGAEITGVTVPKLSGDSKDAAYVTVAPTTGTTGSTRTTTGVDLGRTHDNDRPSPDRSRCRPRCVRSRPATAGGTSR